MTIGMFCSLLIIHGSSLFFNPGGRVEPAKTHAWEVRIDGTSDESV